MSNIGRNEFQEWVSRQYPRARPYLRRLICRALDLRFRGDAAGAEADWEREAEAFLAYYRRRYKTVSCAVKSWDLPQGAIRDVRTGLLLFRWQHRADPVEDFQSQIGEDLRQLDAEVVAALPPPLTPPFQDFQNHLRACLWRRAVSNGVWASVADLQSIVSRETLKVAAWEAEVGSEIDASVSRRFPWGAPAGLADNLRKIIWQQDAPDWRQFLKDALDVATALGGDDWERVESIVTRRVAGPIKNLVSGFPEIDAEDILQDAWVRVLAKYFPLGQDRAPELFALVAVTARRRVIDDLRKRQAPGATPGGSGSGAEPSGPESRPVADPLDGAPDLRRLAYSEFPPHQSLAWTWIDVFRRHPREVAKSCCKETLLANSSRVQDMYKDRGRPQPRFLEPLQEKLGVAFGRTRLKQATREAYPHLLKLVCGETCFYQYLTDDLPGDVGNRLTELRLRDESRLVRGLQGQMPHWAQTVNRVWRPAAIELVFFGAELE